MRDIWVFFSCKPPSKKSQRSAKRPNFDEHFGGVSEKTEKSEDRLLFTPANLLTNGYENRAKSLNYVIADATKLSFAHMNATSFQKPD